LAEASANTADELGAQQALLAVSVARESELPGAALPGKAGSIDRAVAHGEWQSAYDAAMTLPLRGSAALAHVLMVVDGLYEGGAIEASLNVLGRTVDPYAGSPEIYSRLASVFTTLGRSEDAALAQTLAREYSATTEQIAA
jgi:hypothetical protein